jgi:RHS repeat-associated protein
MAGISSSTVNFGGYTTSGSGDCGCPNKKGFNGNEMQNKEFSDGSGLNVYDFNARTYDQQIGRFLQVDPMMDEGGQESLSPFHFSYNNPVRYNDPDGKCPYCPAFAAEIQLARESKGGEQAYFDQKRKEGIGTVILGIAVAAIVYPPSMQVTAPIVAAEVFGVPSPGAPTSMASTVVAETKTVASTVTTETSTVVSIETRAKEIHSALTPATQSRTTTAVASATNAEGKAVTLVASSEKNLRPAQRAVLRSGEIAVSGKGHAEATIMSHAATNGMKVGQIAASRPICTNCAGSINAAGAAAVSSLKKAVVQ